MYFRPANQRQPIDEARYIQALDLVVDELSGYLINFPSFNIHVDNYHATLGAILVQIKEDEKLLRRPSTSKISSLYERLSVDDRRAKRDHMLESVFMNIPSLPWTIMRRVNNQQP